MKKLTKQKLIVATSIGLLVAIPVLAQTIYCNPIANVACGETAVIGGQGCTLNTGFPMTYNVIVENTEEGSDTYQTFCYNWACSYNCNGTQEYGASSADPTVDCNGDQLGTCE